MKHIHPRPDRTEKALIVFNICLLSMLISTMIFYYNVFEETVGYEQKLYQSLFISFLVSLTVGGMISNKYMRKPKEKKIVENVKKE